MSWFNSKSDIRDKIMDIEKDLRSLEYEYCSVFPTLASPYSHSFEIT